MTVEKKKDPIYVEDLVEDVQSRGIGKVTSKSDGSAIEFSPVRPEANASDPTWKKKLLDKYKKTTKSTSTINEIEDEDPEPTISPVKQLI
jgi:hypothetical protein